MGAIKLLLACFCLSVTSFSQTVSIPDPELEFYLIAEGWDSDGVINGQISQQDANSVSFLVFNDANHLVTDLTGVQSMPNLANINVLQANIPTIDLNLIPGVHNADIYGNSGAQNIIISPNTVSFEYLFSTTNPTIDWSNSQSLFGIALVDVPITTVDFSNLQQLEVLHLELLPLSHLNLPPNLPLRNLIAADIPVSSLMLSSYPLTNVTIANTNVTDLDMTGGMLQVVNVYDNPQLTRLRIDDGNNTNVILADVRNNPQLSCIVVDDVNYSSTTWNQPNATPPLYVDTPAALVDANAACATVSVGDVALSHLGLYPNPVRDVLHISGRSSSDVLAHEVYAMDGRLLLQGEGNRIAMGDLVRGNYLVVLRDARGNARHEVVVKE